jgi:hypothetical protein
MSGENAEASAERTRLAALGLHSTLLAPGIATLDLDHAEAELRRSGGVGRVSQCDDPLLGARCRLVVTNDGDHVVLLEPSTEGRLAAALARFGPHRVVEYAQLVPRDADVATVARAAGVSLSVAADGPFGRQRLVLGGPRWGPFVIVVESSGAATIGT